MATYDGPSLSFSRKINLLRSGKVGSSDELAAARRIVAALAKRPASEREDIMRHLPSAGPDDPAEMLDDPGLAELARSGMAIGTQGVSHEPLTAVDDPEAELPDYWQDLNSRLNAATAAPTLSF